MITERGRLAWHKATYFGQRSLVETTMGRYKALLGPRLRARGFAAQQTEAVIGVAVLNTTALGAAELGWYVAEVGRQPWVIEGVLPTFMAVSSLTAGNVLTTLISFITFYSILLIVDTYLMTKAIRLGPAPTDMDIVFRLPADPIAIPAGRVAHLLPHDTAYMAR
jgi:cytochrome bd-type quinol oxidase subunit 1